LWPQFAPYESELAAQAEQLAGELIEGQVTAKPGVRELHDRYMPDRAWSHEA
jgi:hypothetical protein